MARWRYDAQPLLRYAAVQEAPMYREIMEVFAEAAAGYNSRLSPEDIYAALLDRLDPGSDDDDNDSLSLGEVKKRLEQLYKWGNLTQDFDSGRATSLESYEQTAYVYDLTPGGEAAAEALRALDDALRRVGGLQAVALRQIEEMLGQLAVLLRAQRPDGDRIFGLCEDLHARFKSLTTNAALFMQKVNRLLASSTIDVRDFTLFKADTITYLNDFIADLDVFAARIRLRLDDLDQVDPSALKAAFAAGEAASGTLALDAPPALTWADQARRHLAGIAEWFRAGSEARVGAGALYEKTRSAVLGIARSVERIREASSSSSSRSADLLDLAVRFESASSEDEAHQLWHAAFGLSSARHLGIALEDATAVPSSGSWWEPQAAVTISRQLRSGGRSDYVRRAKNVADRSAAKNHLAARARADQERADQAAITLTGLGTCDIGEINDRTDGPLDPAALRLLASLLYRAIRSRRRRNGTRLAVSTDGTLQITMADPLPPGAALLEAETGTWTLPDYQISVEWRANVVAAERAAADIAPAAVAAVPAEDHGETSWRA